MHSVLFVRWFQSHWRQTATFFSNLGHSRVQQIRLLTCTALEPGGAGYEFRFLEITITTTRHGHDTKRPEAQEQLDERRKPKEAGEVFQVLVGSSGAEKLNSGNITKR